MGKTGQGSGGLAGIGLLSPPGGGGQVHGLHDHAGARRGRQVRHRLEGEGGQEGAPGRLIVRDEGRLLSAARHQIVCLSGREKRLSPVRQAGGNPQHGRRRAVGAGGQVLRVDLQSAVEKGLTLMGTGS